MRLLQSFLKKRSIQSCQSLKIRNYNVVFHFFRPVVLHRYLIFQKVEKIYAFWDWYRHGQYVNKIDQSICSLYLIETNTKIREIEVYLKIENGDTILCLFFLYFASLFLAWLYYEVEKRKLYAQLTLLLTGNLFTFFLMKNVDAWVSLTAQLMKYYKN